VPAGRSIGGCRETFFWELTLGLNLDQKQVIVAELSRRVAGAQTIVVAEYRGLTVGALTGLRAAARDKGVYLRVLRNTLARRALAGTGFEGLAEHLVGPLIYGISTDPVAAAQVLSDYAKGNDKLVVKAGSMPGYVMDAAGVKALASMPSREELLSSLLGTMQAPIAQFVRTLNEVPARFVRTVMALKDAREGQPA
jgi:large subunit ribosomal protein L10